MRAFYWKETETKYLICHFNECIILPFHYDSTGFDYVIIIISSCHPSRRIRLSRSQTNTFCPAPPPWLRSNSSTLHFEYVIKVKTFSNFFHSRGVWNSPFISSIYLIQKQVLNKMQGSFGPSRVDPDMALCQYFRDRVSISICDVKEGNYDLICHPPSNKVKKVSPLPNTCKQPHLNRQSNLK